MNSEWRRTVENTIATMPRLGWKGRWDALLYALKIHKFLRTEEAPLTFSVWSKGADIKIELSGAQIEQHSTRTLPRIKASSIPKESK